MDETITLASVMGEDTTNTVITEAPRVDLSATVSVTFTLSTTYRAEGLSIETIRAAVSQAATDQGVEMVEPTPWLSDDEEPDVYVDELLAAQRLGVTRQVLALLKDNADVEDDDYEVDEVEAVE